MRRATGTPGGGHYARPGHARRREARKTGRRKTYETAEALESAVQAYFDSISVMETLKERVPTGRKDKYGHEITKLVEVKNTLGKPIFTRVFYVPPEVFGLAEQLGISTDTWRRYGEDETLSEVVTWAEEVMEGWKNRELLRRENKRTGGLIYEMERNHKRKQSGDDVGGRAAPMVALTDAQLIALAAQAGEG